MTIYTHLGRLWTLDYISQNMHKLLHFKKRDNWRYGSKKWILPNEGEEGYIESVDFGWVLGLNEYGTSSTGVELQPKNSSDEANQKWAIGYLNDHQGYFTIKSSSNDMFLSIDSNGNPFIEGNDQLISRMTSFCFHLPKQ